MEVELRILCGNKEGHCIKRYFRTNKTTDYEIEYDIREELEKYKATYEYLRIQKYDKLIIATAYNGS